MILADISLFFGKFHPLIVHLPIGFLLLAVVFSMIGQLKKFRLLLHAVPFTLLIGSISAVFACITGLLLAQGGDYDQNLLTVHQWIGILTAVLSIIAYAVSIQKIPVRFLKTRRSLTVLLAFILLSISITGHYGGSLTHGDDYLSVQSLFKKKRPPVTDINQAVVFDDIILPILDNKCGKCHNNGKKKGELSMADYAMLMKGGKNGVVLVAGDPMGSEMIKRVMLKPSDEKFMPTDGKPPLTEQEREIIKWWIEKTGADPHKKFAEYQPSAEVKNYILASLKLGGDSSIAGNTSDTVAGNASSEIVNVEKLPTVPAVSEETVTALEKEGFVIKYIHLQPVLLDVTLPGNTIASSDASDEKIAQLLPVKDNIIWLNISGNQIADKGMERLGDFKNLQRLRLENNPLTDEGIASLTKLASLESINLCSTKVTQKIIPALAAMKNLKSVYVWGTGIGKDYIHDDKKSSLKIVSGMD